MLTRFKDIGGATRAMTGTRATTARPGRLPPVLARFVRTGLAAGATAIMTLGLAGCASQAPVPSPGPVAIPAPASPPVEPARLQVIFASLQQVGVPYAYGGATPAGFDCSGLVQYVFANAGVALPRTAAAQHATAQPLALRDAAPGDLLFFRDRGTTSHVGIYIGDGRFVHAPRTGRSVALETFETSYWRNRFAGAGRVMPGL